MTAILAWFAGLKPVAKALAAFGVVAAVTVVLGGLVLVGYLWGLDAAGRDAAEDRVEKLKGLITELVDYTQAAVQATMMRQERDEERRDIRARAVIEIDPAGCRLSDDERLRYNARVRARNCASGGPCGVQDPVPTGAGDAPD